MEVKPMKPMKPERPFCLLGAGPSGHPGLFVRGYRKCFGDNYHASASSADDVCDTRLDAQVPRRMDMLLVH